jgi:hypothetical protein
MSAWLAEVLRNAGYIKKVGRFDFESGRTNDEPTAARDE